MSVHRALHLWGASDAVAWCSLFQSAYSNLHVNYAIFDLSTNSEITNLRWFY
jgi:hypothetical protein